MPLMTVHIGSLVLRNPVICGSGEPVMTAAGIRAALAAGAAGVIAKSVNEQPQAARQLDRADYAQLDEQHRAAGHGVSIFCRSGLAQYDPGEWFETLGQLHREVSKQDQFVGASLVYASRAGAVNIARLARSAGLPVFELNVGAPHASEASPGAITQEAEPARLGQLVKDVRQVTTGMQLWVKLTGLSSNLPELAVAAQRAGADAVCMMGRFMAMAPDIDTLAPILGTFAAYGGSWALPIVCRYLALSRKTVSNEFPLLGTNGVRTGADVVRMALAGASAVEVLSVIMHEGFGGLSRIISELEDFLTERRLTFSELIGRAADAIESYAEQPERLGRWRDFVPPETLGG